MSKSMRAASVKWGPHASLCIDPERFPELAEAIVHGEIKFSYDWNDADGVFKFWTGQGRRFLDRVRDCDAKEVAGRIDEPGRNDAVSCMENLRALEESWRAFVDEDGALELWIDGY